MAMADSTRPSEQGKAKPCKHENESPEDRRLRLAKRAADRKLRIAAETPEQRAARLAKANERESKRNARLSPEQKQKLAEYRKAYFLANKDRLRIQQKEYRRRTKQAKSVTDKAYREANKERISAQRKLYNEANRDVISNKKKLRYRKNAEEIKLKERLRRQRDPQRYRDRHNNNQKRWRAKNKERVRAIYRRHMTKKRRTDVLFALKCVVRERILCAVSRQGSRKSSRTIDLIGCTVAELARHLESKFLPGMTWENRGANGWHIDHIIPIAKFDLSDPQQQAAAFHYTNLQPLWAEDNRRKGTTAPGQNLFGFAYAARIADAASAKPKRRRKHGGQHGDH